MPVDWTRDLRQAEKNIEGDFERKSIRGLITIGDKGKPLVALAEASPYLNQPGIEREIEIAARTTDAEAVAFDEELTATLDERIKNVFGVIEKAVTPPAPDGDGVKAAFAEATRQNVYSGIRRNIESLGLDALGREQAYLLADSPEARAAMETAPPLLVKTQDGVRWEPWVRPELILEARMGRAARKDPESVAALRALQSQRATHKHFVNVLRAAIRKSVPALVEIRLRDLDGRDVTPTAKK